MARTLALSPEPIIADEQTACYDASVQGEVLNLFENLLADMGVSILITTRNLFLL